jgi:hypothetical protein
VVASSGSFAYDNPEQSLERQCAIPLSDHEKPNDGFDVGYRFDCRHSTHFQKS